MTDKRGAEYYEKIIYYRCNLCSQRWNIFKAEYRMIEHLLKEHKFKLDKEDKIALLRKLSGTAYIAEKDCLEYGIDFNRFKKIRR